MIFSKDLQGIAHRHNRHGTLPGASGGLHNQVQVGSSRALHNQTQVGACVTKCKWGQVGACAIKVQVEKCNELKPVSRDKQGAWGARDTWAA